MTASHSWILIWLYGLVFGFIHSALATSRCKRWAHRYLSPQHYRLCYSVLGVVMTSAWMVCMHTLPDQQLYHAHGLLFWLAISIQLIALVLLALSFRSFDGMLFLGLKKPPASLDSFHISGLYHHVRHPMYSAVILLLLASPVQSSNSLNLALVITLYFIVGSRLEERRMLRQFPQYGAYCLQTPAFIPAWRNRSDL
ncbi:MAG: hypothetical protein AUJ56_02565 [Zetaproteobacteria bacterium CG1_02_49_23]|nr:MAG: hypothetical protein AUJ56_02565 [Zetaproteobacteria bacterium CG1_02_49_23]